MWNEHMFITEESEKSVSVFLFIVKENSVGGNFGTILMWTGINGSANSYRTVAESRMLFRVFWNDVLFTGFYYSGS